MSLRRLYSNLLVRIQKLLPVRIRPKIFRRLFLYIYSGPLHLCIYQNIIFSRRPSFPVKLSDLERWTAARNTAYSFAFEKVHSLVRPTYVELKWAIHEAGVNITINGQSYGDMLERRLFSSSNAHISIICVFNTMVRLTRDQIKPLSYWKQWCSLHTKRKLFAYADRPVTTKLLAYEIWNAPSTRYDSKCCTSWEITGRIEEFFHKNLFF